MLTARKESEKRERSNQSVPPICGVSIVVVGLVVPLVVELPGGQVALDHGHGHHRRAYRDRVSHPDRKAGDGGLPEVLQSYLQDSAVPRGVVHSV